jgi:SAM-dependent methyltransferase
MSLTPDTFCEFYSTALGQAAGHQIQACIRNLWPDLTGQSLLGIGYTMPYLDFYLRPSQSILAFVPGQDAVPPWPSSNLNRLALMKNEHLPLPDQCMDFILMIHALEHAHHVPLMLREVWRVLKGNGRLLVIVPNRRSMWAHLDTTPFGYGQPYTMTQLVNLLHNNFFTSVTFRRALYMIPGHSRWMSACQTFLDKSGPLILQKFSGVVCVESIKQICAGTPLPVRKTKFSPVFNKCQS